MTSVLQMMRFKQESLGPSYPSLFLPALVLCLAVSLWANTASGAGAPPQTGEAVAIQGRVPAQPISLASDEAQGLINLDVVVTDNSRKAIPGLGTQGLYFARQPPAAENSFLSRVRWNFLQARSSGRSDSPHRYHRYAV
jgi:hypothetical protein